MISYSMSETKLHSVYIIDKGKFPKLRSTKRIVEQLKASFPGEYRKQNLKIQKSNDFQLLLLYKQETPQNVLSTFFKSVVKRGAEILDDKYRGGSSILLLWDDINIFAIPTGKGYLYIKEFVVSDFGFRFASLFKDKIAIGAMSQNELGGNVYSNSSVFISEMAIQSLQNADSIAKNMHGRVRDESTVDDIIPETTRGSKNPKIEIKSFLKFGRSLNFHGMTALLKNITVYAKNQAGTDDLCKLNDDINFVSKIDKKSSEHSQCLDALILVLTKNISRKEDLYFIINEDPLSYKEAQKYAIVNSATNDSKLIEKEDEITNADIIEAFNTYKNTRTDRAEDSVATMQAFLQDALICSYNESSELITRGTIISHLTGDITARGKSYFIINGEFLRIQEDIKANIISSAKNILNSVIEGKELLGVDWGSDCHNEDDFNDKVCQQSANEQCQFHLFHRNIPDSTEFADIIKFEGNDAYIIHVKDKFDHAMRALSKQVEASLLQYEAFKRNNNSSYMNKLYDNAIERDSSGNFAESFPEYKDFKEKLAKSTVSYVMAIHNGNKKLSSTRSVTALYCLEQTYRHCIRRGINLIIATI